MYIRLVKFFFGIVRIKVEGVFFERFLNLCNNQDLLLWDLLRTETGCVLWIYAKDFKKIRPLVKKTGCHVTIIEKRGIPFYKHRYRKRKIFLGGVVLSVMTIYILSLFIWNIDFTGNVSQSSKELSVYLESIGVSPGIAKSEVSCEEIESRLRITYPNLLWVSAQIKGTRILIQVKENTDPDIITEIKEKDTAATSIVAKEDGIIDSIIVRQGTPLVGKGDSVLSGETLVEGYYDIKNDAGEVIRYEPVCADADIYILTEEAYQDRFLNEYKIKEYTGKKRAGIILKIGKHTINLHPQKSPYAYFDTVDKIYDLKITEDFYLPFQMEINWYLEYVPKIHTYDEKQVEELAKQRFLKKYENILQKGVQIIEKDVKINTNGKLCLVSGRVKLLVLETTKVPATLPDPEYNASLEGEQEI